MVAKDRVRICILTIPSKPIVEEEVVDNGFDMGSFFGGVVLTVGVTGTGYFGLKFYRAHNPDYRHI